MNEWTKPEGIAVENVVEFELLMEDGRTDPWNRNVKVGARQLLMKIEKIVKGGLKSVEASPHSAKPGKELKRAFDGKGTQFMIVDNQVTVNGAFKEAQDVAGA